MQDLYKKIKNGFKWTLIGNIFKGGVSFLLLLFLTWQLGPKKLGLISIITIIYGLSETFVQFGISQSIIARRDNSNKELSSIFWTNFAIGFFVFILINVIAKSLAGFYYFPELEILIRVLSVIFLIEPLDLVFRAILEKKLKFSILEKINILKYLTLGLATVILIFLNFDVMGYIIAMILSVIISTIFLTLFFLKGKMWLPQFYFNLNDIKKHYEFGLFITAKSFLNFIGTKADELIIGKILGLELLGVYYFAKNILKKPVSLFAGSLSKIIFPILAKVKTNIKLLNTAYLDLSHFTAIIGVGFLGFIILTAPYFVNLFFTEEWKSLIPLIQIFAIISLIELLTSGLNTAILLIFNKPKFIFKVNLFFTTIRIISFTVAALFSIELVAILYLFIMICKTIISRNKVNKLLNSSFKEYIVKISNPFKYGIFSYILSLLILYSLSINNSIILLATSTLLYFIFYLSLLYLKYKNKMKFIYNNIIK